jgi:uncharacterized DUF497 family protein
MKILPEPLSFEWDKGNINKNLKKHKVTNQEAEEAFKNKPVFIFKDEEHSTLREGKYGLFGRTNRGRQLSIAFTIRKDKIRIVMARDISKKERRAYEKVKTHSQV